MREGEREGQTERDRGRQRDRDRGGAIMFWGNGRNWLVAYLSLETVPRLFEVLGGDND